MAAWLIIETQKAAISRKWIQSALHMNELMNKNKVIHLCELCLKRRETQERVEGRGGAGDRLE